ncbi:MAG: ABC transporter permease [Anaerolineaceae bacterium]|nr:ABC transporter permease [Anaerolineaceae bacterium]
MRKLLIIAFKDVLLIFRDRAALLFMFLAPFALTIGLSLATGSFSGKSNSGILDLPIVIVNDDNGQLGNALVEMVQSDQLADLLEPEFLTDLEIARKMVDDNKTVAVVYVPSGFTNSIIPNDVTSNSTQIIQLELYGNPSSPTGVGVVRNLLEQFISEVEVGRVSGTLAVTQLLESGAIDPSQAMKIGQAVGELQTDTQVGTSSIKLNNVTAAGTEVKFNMLALLAPGMALMFLMYTVSNGGRTLLVEKAGGTLPRMLISPTSSFQILGGKVFGIFLTGLAQLVILILGTTLLFKLDWGDPLAVLVLVAAAALAATGWGILLAAVLNTSGQVSAVGTAIMLIFGILGGSFTNIAIMPNWVQWISRISPNRWGLDGFTTLAMGGNLANIMIPVIALLIMAAVLFLVSVVLFSRRGIGKE